VTAGEIPARRRTFFRSTGANAPKDCFSKDAVKDVIAMVHTQHDPAKKDHPGMSFFAQTLIVLLVIALLLLLVLFADTYLHDIGKDWSDSTLVKMIMERREAIPLFE
jgi:hypothetical protein